MKNADLEVFPQTQEKSENTNGVQEMEEWNKLGINMKVCDDDRLLGCCTV